MCVKLCVFVTLTRPTKAEIVSRIKEIPKTEDFINFLCLRGALLHSRQLMTHTKIFTPVLDMYIRSFPPPLHFYLHNTFHFYTSSRIRFLHTHQQDVEAPYRHHC